MSEKHTCEGLVGGSFDFRPCGNKAKVEHNGKRYCGIHNPVRRAEQQAKRDAKYEAGAERQRKRWALERATSDLLEACKEMLEGRKGARDKARAAIAKAEGTE